jgi:hypothetical protein
VKRATGPQPQHEPSPGRALGDCDCCASPLGACCALGIRICCDCWDGSCVTCNPPDLGPPLPEQARVTATGTDGTPLL